MLFDVFFWNPVDPSSQFNDSFYTVIVSCYANNVKLLQFWRMFSLKGRAANQNHTTTLYRAKNSWAQMLLLLWSQCQDTRENGSRHQTMPI